MNIDYTLEEEGSPVTVEAEVQPKIEPEVNAETKAEVL